LRELKKNLSSRFRVIRTTSPFDGDSLWIEIFPTNVSKGLGSEYLRLKEGIPLQNVLSIGNDYNDLDLLSWSPSVVVKNAPESLKQRFFTLNKTNCENAFSEAISLWKENKLSLSLNLLHKLLEVIIIELNRAGLFPFFLL